LAVVDTAADTKFAEFAPVALGEAGCNEQNVDGISGEESKP
jgi:hypothetical protein|tara:strand:- start:92818 stop:92940 length:123 start_codon:yes stop_codon:yes gene_type:complete